MVLKVELFNRRSQILSTSAHPCVIDSLCDNVWSLPEFPSRPLMAALNHVSWQRDSREIQLLREIWPVCGMLIDGAGRSGRGQKRLNIECVNSIEYWHFAVRNWLIFGLKSPKNSI